MSENETKALARRSVTQVLEAYDQSKFNLIMPITQSDSVPRGMKVIARIVKLDVTDSYPVEGKHGLSKNQIEKIGQAAGISWKDIERKDDRRQPHYYEFKAVGTILDFDGMPKDCIGNKVVDLRSDDGTGHPGKDARGMSDKQLAQARKFGAEQCATKSMLRCISAALAIKRAYPKEWFDRPVVVPRLSPDTEDEQARNMVMASAFGATSALYGKPSVVDASQPLESVEAPPDDEDLGYDPETGEVPPDVSDPPPAPAELTREQITARVQAAWNKAKPKGIDVAKWKELLRASTGQVGYDGLTAEKLDALDKAVAELK